MYPLPVFPVRFFSITVRRRGKAYSYYVCSARWKGRYLGDRCQSRSLVVDALEEEVFGMVADFLYSPEGFGNEMQLRRAITAESQAGLIRQLDDLRRQDKEEREAEARAFRPTAHEKVSEEVFSQEVSLIRTRRHWIAEQMERRNSFMTSSDTASIRRVWSSYAGAWSQGWPQLIRRTGGLSLRRWVSRCWFRRMGLGSLICRSRLRPQHPRVIVE